MKYTPSNEYVVVERTCITKCDIRYKHWHL